MAPYIGNIQNTQKMTSNRTKCTKPFHRFYQADGKWLFTRMYALNRNIFHHFSNVGDGCFTRASHVNLVCTIRFCELDSCNQVFLPMSPQDIQSSRNISISCALSISNHSRYLYDLFGIDIASSVTTPLIHSHYEWLIWNISYTMFIFISFLPLPPDF